MQTAAPTDPEIPGAVGGHAMCSRDGLLAQLSTVLVELRALAATAPPGEYASWQLHLTAIKGVADFVRATQNPSASASFEQMELLREFGLLLSDRRRAAGLSRREVAKFAKLSDATIKFVETARHMPSRTTLLCLTSVPQLKLSWADIPFEVGGRTPFHTRKEGRSDAATSVHRSSLAAVTSNLNCYLSPSLEPLRMVMDLHRCLNSSGGFIEPASLYIEHQSAASYLAMCRRHGPTQELRHRLPLADIAHSIAAATESEHLTIFALGSGDAQTEVRFTQLLQQQQRKLHLVLLDLSPPLLSIGLQHATAVLGDSPDVKVCGALVDFRQLPLLPDLDVQQRAGTFAAKRRPRVYCMLGDTLQSLDHELRFVQYSLGAEVGDFLVVDLAASCAAAGTADAADSVFPAAYEEWLGGLLRRHGGSDSRIEFSVVRSEYNSIPGSFAIDAIAVVQCKDAPPRRFSMYRWKRYDFARLVASLAQLQWELLVRRNYGVEAGSTATVLVLRKRTAT